MKKQNNVTVNIRIPEDMKDFGKVMAMHQGVSFSEYIRRLIFIDMYDLDQDIISYELAIKHGNKPSELAVKAYNRATQIFNNCKYYGQTG